MHCGRALARRCWIRCARALGHACCRACALARRRWASHARAFARRASWHAARAAARRWCLRRAPQQCLHWLTPDDAELGELGEELAARALRRLGWRILARRWRGPGGEVDLVAREGAQLVLVEVKSARAHARPASGSEPALDLRWRPGQRAGARTIERLAYAARRLAARGGPVRVDLVEVFVGPRRGALRMLHHRDVRGAPARRTPDAGGRLPME
jgi:putative endonuclease